MNEDYESEPEGRPTCGTCPYWWIMDWVDDDREAHSGHCRIMSPKILIGNSKEAILWGEWPTTLRCNGCGEHPDFLAWATKRKEHHESA